MLSLDVITKNGKEHKEQINLQKRSGSYIYPIVGKDFVESGGIESYKIVLLLNGTQIAASKHKLWVDQIKVSD